MEYSFAYFKDRLIPIHNGHSQARNVEVFKSMVDEPVEAFTIRVGLCCEVISRKRMLFLRMNS